MPQYTDLPSTNGPQYTDLPSSGGPQYTDLPQAAPQKPAVTGAGPNNATVSAHTPGFWESARNMLFNTSVGDAIRRNVPIAPDWMKSHLNPQTEDAERQHGQTLSFEEMGRWGQNGAERPSGPRQATTRVLQAGSGFTTPGMMLGAAMLGPAAEAVAGAAPFIAPVAEHAIPLAFTGMAASGAAKGVVNEAQYGEAYLKAKGLLEEAQQRGDAGRADEIQKYLTHLHDAMWQTGGDVAANAAMAYLGRRGLPEMIKGFKGEGKFIGPRVDPTDHAYWEGMIPGSLRSQWAAGNTEATPQTARNPWGNLTKGSGPEMLPISSFPFVRNPEQLNLPLEGNAIPEPPAQRSFDFSQLPEQRIVARGPEAEANGQLRLFPNEPRQMELRPEERPAGVPEGPSAQTAFQFPQNPWQMPLDFDQPAPKARPAEPVAPKAEPQAETAQTNPAEAAPHQATNPSPEAEPTAKPTPKKRGNVAQALAMEKDFRPVVQTISKLAELKRSGEERFHVENAVRASSQHLFSDEDLAEFKKMGWTPPTNLSNTADNPFLDTNARYDALDDKERATVDSVAKTLGVKPESLYTEDGEWRLADDQLSDLKSKLETGKKSLGAVAHINPENAAAAGLKNARSLRELMSPEDRLALEREESRQGPEAIPEEFDPSSSKARAGLNATAESMGLRITGSDEAGFLGLNEDNPAVREARMRGNQGVLQAAIDRGVQALRERVPMWEQKRSGTGKPSPLAQEIAAMDPSIRALLPKELYDPKHTGASTGDTAETSHVQEPVQGAKATETAPAAQAAANSKNAQGQSPELVDRIHDLAQDIQGKHGDQAFGALPQIFDAVSEKFKNPENVNKVLFGVMRKYKSYLDNGVEEPLKKALADTLDKLGPEKGTQSKLYSNPLGPVWDKMFGKRPTAMLPEKMPGPLALPESPLSKFTEELHQQTPPSNQEAMAAFLKNEATKVKDFLEATPEMTRDTFRRLNEMRQSAWTAYSQRPGLNPLERALGYRRLQLTQDALVARRFVDDVMKLHPDASRREAMVNYLQASGGVMSDTDVGAMLRQKADAFDPARNPALGRFSAGYIQKLRRGYLDAGNLTEGEKKTIDLYRAYDHELQRSEADQGLELHARENYIRQIWDKDSLARKEIDGMFSSGAFSTNASFMKMRKFEDYFEGEQAGLKPHRKDFAYLVSARARASAEVLANRSLIDHLYDETMPDGSKLAEVQGIGVSQTPSPDKAATKGAILIKQGRPSDAVTQDGRPYVTINHPAFQNWKWVSTADDGTTILYKGSMLVHPDVAGQLRNILEPSAIRKSAIGRAALTMSSVGKQTLLIGLFHPVQLAVHFTEHLAEGGASNPTRTMRALNPFADSVIDLSKTDQQTLVMHGLKLLDFGAESMWDEGVMSRGLASGSPYIGKFWRSLHDAMFTKYIPNLKMAMAQDALERNLSRYHDKYAAEEMNKLGHSGLPADFAEAQATQKDYGYASLQAQSRIYRMTADQMNSAFGGINWDHLPVSKTWQDVARLTVLAPDFLLARAQFVGDAARPGGMESLKALAIGALIQYTATRAFNSGMNDGDAKWDIQDWNKFIVGRHSYSLRTVQGDIVDSVTDPRRFWSHRMNPVTLRPIVEAATGKDVFGHPASAGQQMVDFVKNVVPMPLQGAFDAAVGKVDPSKRVGKNDEQIADTIVQSMLGVQRKQYRTPAEREVFSDFDAIQGPQTRDELAMEQKNTFVRLRDAYRSGKLTPDMIEKAVNDPNGNLKASEIPYLFRSAKQTELVRRAQHLEYGQVKRAWEKGSEAERMDLLPILISKSRTLAPERQQSELDALQQYADSISPDKAQKLNDAIQEQITWENQK